MKLGEQSSKGEMSFAEAVVTQDAINQREEAAGGIAMTMTEAEAYGFKAIFDWLGDAKLFARLDESLEIYRMMDINDRPRIRIRFYTATNRYSLEVVKETDQHKSYLGCTVSTRTPLAGELQTRGSDLHDGRYEKFVWQGILADVVSHEMIPLQY